MRCARFNARSYMRFGTRAVELVRSDIGHTLYSFESYQNIAGCKAPSGKVADSTDSTVSHEIYETMTDPDINNGTFAWYNSWRGEIGNICRSNDRTIVLNAIYNIQEEWVEPLRCVQLFAVNDAV